MNPIRVSFRTTQMVRPLLEIQWQVAIRPVARRAAVGRKVASWETQEQPILGQDCLNIALRETSAEDFGMPPKWKAGKGSEKFFLCSKWNTKIFVCSSNRKLFKARLYFAMTKNQWLTGFLGSWLLPNCGLNPWILLVCTVQPDWKDLLEKIAAWLCFKKLWASWLTAYNSFQGRFLFGAYWLRSHPNTLIKYQGSMHHCIRPGDLVLKTDCDQGQRSD